MFTKQQVDQVVEKLSKSSYCYVSEAHLQVQFAIEAYRLFGDNFEIYPEYPLTTNYPTGPRRSEFDLLIFDKSTREKTLIEFKYKTRNGTYSGKRYDFPVAFGQTKKLANDGAHNPNRYACWKDIYRIESPVKNKQVDNGFFVFVTNDWLYVGTDGSDYICSQKGVKMFSIANGEHQHMIREIDPSIPTSSIGEFPKKNPLDIQNDYYFEYKDFQNFTDIPDWGKFWSLVVEIK